MHRILVVDDEPVNAKLLKFLLEDEGYHVITADDASKALRELDKEPFDLIILDVMLPDMNGIELCQQIRVKTNIPILFISVRGETKDKVSGLRAGGDDYLSKPFEPVEALARVWALLRRGSQLANSASNTQNGDLTLDVAGNSVTLARNGKTVRLTPLEVRLLQCLVSNPGRVLPRETLVINVWGYSYEDTSNQLDVYIWRLRKKIEENPRQPRLIQTIRGIGYKFQPSASATASPELQE